MKPSRPTKNNYYSKEMDRAYFSASQVKTFLSCEARALAQIRGEWEQGTSAALMIGSYVDAAFEGPKAFQMWKREHPELYKRDGTLKSDYVRADAMIERCKSDPLFMEYMRGQKQKIATGKIAGVPFKCKFDVYRKGERIVDLKTVKDFGPVYMTGQGRMDFATAYNWPLQMAIYQAVEGHHLPCYLAVVTKEDPPSIEVIEVEQSRLDAEMEFLTEKLPRFDAIKRGIVEPERCEHCAYCRATKRLKAPISLTEMEFNQYE